MHATVEGVAKVKLSGDLVTRRQVHDKRFGSGSKPKFAHCSPVKKQMIKEAVKDAQGALEEAIAQIDSEDHGTSFTTWFGRVPDLSYIVRKNLEGFKILLDFSGYTFDCNCGDNFPSEISKFTLQLRDRRSVTDKSLNQSPTTKKSGSANHSGNSCRVPNRLKSSAWPPGATRASKLRQLV